VLLDSEERSVTINISHGRTSIIFMWYCGFRGLPFLAETDSRAATIDINSFGKMAKLLRRSIFQSERDRKNKIKTKMTAALWLPCRWSRVRLLFCSRDVCRVALDWCYNKSYPGKVTSSTFAPLLDRHASRPLTLNPHPNSFSFFTFFTDPYWGVWTLNARLGSVVYKMLRDVFPTSSSTLRHMMKPELLRNLDLDILKRRHWGCKTIGAAILFPKFLRKLQCIFNGAMRNKMAA